MEPEPEVRVVKDRVLKTSDNRIAVPKVMWMVSHRLGSMSLSVRVSSTWAMVPLGAVYAFLNHVPSSRRINTV